MKKFLGIQANDCKSGSAKFQIIPFGLEKTVSFGAGTKKGPKAIIKASQEVELFDSEYLCEIYHEYGVETLPKLKIKENHKAALDQLANLVRKCLSENKIPVVLGGEHSISYGSILPFIEKYQDGLTIVQFDAHLDLRNAYEGDRYSHASVMRRCIDHNNVELISIGIRNISQEEYEFYPNHPRIHVFDNTEANNDRLIDKLSEITKGKNVFITFDVDGLDPSIMPATGTPEPDGLSWINALNLIRAIASSANIVGMDIVELAPVKGMHSPDFIIAKLIYKMMSYTHRIPEKILHSNNKKAN